MAQPPWETQLPGVPDSQVGTSDFPNQNYPWQQPSAVPMPEPTDSHARPHPMEMERDMTSHVYENSSDHHTIAAGEPSGSSSQQSHRSLPVNPNHVNGHPATPPGFWVWQPIGASPNQLPPITSLGLAQYLPNAWNPTPPQIAPFEYASIPTSSPTPFDTAQLECLAPHMHEHHSLPEAACEACEPESEESKDLDCETQNFAPLCEFSRPCKMSPSPDGVHFRKIVSHLFGRNKASTKLFPESVWVYYCRKHYQRARYRAEQWPFNQCELLMQSLDRMEEWGNVLFFELRLRRREALRADGQGERPSPTGLLRNGRRHPTAITAPVPEWLQREVGTEKSFNDIRHIVERIRAYLTRLKQEEDSKKIARAKLSSAAALSKDDKKIAQNAAYRERNSLVRFPDIEILPTFHPRVLEEARQRSSQKKRGNKDGSEGANEQEELNEREEYSEDDGGNFEENAETSGQGRRKTLKLVTRVSSKGAIKKPAGKKRK